MINQSQAAEIIRALNEMNRVLVVIATALEKLADKPAVHVSQGAPLQSQFDYSSR